MCKSSLLGLSTQQPSDENTSTLPENLTLILVTLAAAVVLLIVIIVTVVTYLACRRQPTTTTTVVMRQRRSSKPPDEFELSEGGFGEGFHRRSAQYAASLYMPDIDETHRRFSGLYTYISANKIKFIVQLFYNLIRVC